MLRLSQGEVMQSSNVYGAFWSKKQIKLSGPFGVGVLCFRADIERVVELSQDKQVFDPLSFFHRELLNCAAPFHTPASTKNIPDAGLDTATATAAFLQASPANGYKVEIGLSLCICPGISIRKRKVLMEAW